MRKSRYYYESNFYHIMTQGDEKKYIFHSAKNKWKMIYLLKHNAFRNDVEIISYCIMDNHVHLLVFCPEQDRVSKMMQQSNTSFGLYFTNKREKVGHVFRDRFRSEPIYTKSHLINCIKYIHNNPVKAGICKEPKNYKYSSFNVFQKMNENIRNICDFSSRDVEDIKKDSNTITMFLEDEYSKRDIQEVFDELKKMYHGDCKKNENIIEFYKELKKNCKIADYKIAELLGIHRATLLKKLKDAGIR